VEEFAGTLSYGSGGPSLQGAVAQSAAVLVVDDQPLAREVLLAQCRQLGHRAVASGPEGWRAALDQGPFQVLLVDRRMPLVEGPALLEQLRREHLARGWPAPRAVLISGEACESDRAEVLIKPIRLAQLAALLAAESR
jgi:CheY-like chemotaxis protein